MTDLAASESQKTNLPAGLAEAGTATVRKPLVAIRPPTRWAALRLSEIAHYRDLLTTLAARDIKLRYKQTFLGIAWVIFQPLLAAGIFTFVFGLIAKLPSDGVPYFLFSFAGLLGWNLFNNVLSRSSGSLVSNAHLISKVFFPRLVLPLSTLGSAGVDFAVTFGMMIVLYAVYHVAPGWAFLTLPLWIAFLAVAGIGAGLWTAALSVQFRDVQYIMPVFTQLLFFASPVPYATSAVPEKLLVFYYANPLTAPLVGARWALVGTPPPALGGVVYSAVVAAVVLFAGIVAFKRMERRFADVI